ncbi:MAG: helix-turn-helix domain-containing protein [Paenibacillus sp.]|uniref:AraC family transcriptional regulator n=1 Tax=Paenibacillus sp. TaxID=58172 RepID=UPI0029145D17|nr:helix-turn-helix domain-containing protein [Paenibacillus sp.]MDU4697144.1 helix-turn-helix domain-containing protein [Paenibacillus sp.]
MPPFIEFIAPPLPHYIVSGSAVIPVGGKHPSRQNIGAFDLLVVEHGRLFIGEEDRHYEVTAGHALILRPDCYHYALEGCREDTLHHWLHFQLMGDWRIIEGEEYRHCGCSLPDRDMLSAISLPPFTATSYTVPLPQYAKLAQPQKIITLLNELTDLNRDIHLDSVRLRQQALFQNVIVELSASSTQSGLPPQSACAEKAASYLREHYDEPFSAQKLGESINFHPVYIARCMQKVFGCSPAVYLQRLRIEQAKLLLLQTDLTIERIAEQVGFNQAAYFTACFSKIEGMSPRKYRQRFIWNQPDPSETF